MDNFSTSDIISGIPRQVKLVYFSKIEQDTEDGTMLIKIGSTHHIRQRTSNLCQYFKRNLEVVNFFICEKNVQFENFMHMKASNYLYDGKINGVKSKEVFKFDEDSFNNIKSIAFRNVERFRVYMDENEYVEKVSKRGISTVNGRKIQKYSPNGELVCTYDQVSTAVRSSPEVKEHSLRKACDQKTILDGHRWAYLARTEDDETHQDIGKTLVVKKPHTGFVVTLDSNKRRIVDVYTSMKHLAEEEGTIMATSISKRVKKNKPLDDGRYVEHWTKLVEEQKEEWLEENEMPELKTNHMSKPVEKIDIVTGDIIKTYKTSKEVYEKYKIGKNSLQSAISSGTPKNGFIWKFVEK